MLSKIKILNKIKYMYSASRKAGYIFNILACKEFEKSRMEGEIIRNVHSIEKGLSLENVRIGFGYAKIKQTLSLINKYVENGGNIDNKPIIMFCDALHSYLDFHHDKIQNEQINEISQAYYALKNKILEHDCTSFGGYKILQKHLFSEDELTIIEQLFNNRHSIREFSKKPVDNLLLEKAIRLAMHCPSACNRQGYRCHIISKDKYHILRNWLEGVGGFFDETDKFILITGKISSYRKEEEMQWVITATVFASYLTISLEALSIGCCFIQRSIVPSQQWKQISSQLQIPQDEQIVCALGIGNLKDNYKVPISYRLPYENIVTTH